MNAEVEAWMKALLERHLRPLGKPAFLRAVRALSARYVERRHLLTERSAFDSMGKRAAFAAFFAPLHFMTTFLAVQQTGLSDAPTERIVDLGCGTGAAAAAWAMASARRPIVSGIDIHPWAVAETNWTWRTLNLNGHASRGDLIAACQRLRQARRAPAAGTSIVLGWAVNELSNDGRRVLLPLLLDLARDGASVLVIEPVARRITPWWDEWAATFGEAGGVSEDLRFAITFTGEFAELDRDAGFRREELSARSLSIKGRSRKSF